MTKIPRIIPDSKRSEIIRLMLMGHPRDSVAYSTGVSPGSVSNHWKLFKKRAREMGPEAAVRAYAVEDVFNELRSLASDLNKEGLTISQAKAGARVKGSLRKLKVDENKIEQFILSFYKHSEEKGYIPEDLVEYAIVLYRLEKETGHDYSSLIKTCLERRSELDHLNIQVQTFRREAENAERERNEALSEHGLTIETLNEYRRVRDELSSYGVDIRDVPRLSTMIKSSKELGFSLSRINNYISSIESLSEHKSKLNGEIEALKKDKSALQLSRGKLVAEITTLTGQKGALEASIRTLTEVGVKNIEKMREKSVEDIKELKNREVTIIKQYIEEINDALKSVKDYYDESSLNIKNFVDEMKASISEIRDKSIETGKKIGKLEAIIPIHQLFEGFVGEPHQVYSAMYIISQRFMAWTRKHLPIPTRFDYALQQLIKELEIEMKA